MFPHDVSLQRWSLLLAASLGLVLFLHPDVLFPSAEPAKLVPALDAHTSFRRLLSILVFFGTLFALKRRFPTLMKRMASFVEEEAEVEGEASGPATRAILFPALPLGSELSMPFPSRYGYVPQGLQLQKAEFSSIVRNWTIGLLLFGTALLAAFAVAVLQKGEAGGVAHLISFSAVAVCVYVVLGSWAVWCVSLSVLSAVAARLADAFRRPDTMTKDSRGLPDLAAYLNWFQHLRRELRETSEAMSSFALCGIGGCLSLAFLSFAWAPTGDAVTIVEGVLYLLLAILLLAPAASVTHEFEAVLPSLVHSLALTPAAYDRSDTLAANEAEDRVLKEDLDSAPEAPLPGDIESGTARQRLTAVVKEHNLTIGFLLNTTYASDALTCYGMPLSNSLAFKVGTAGCLAVALLLL